MTNEQRRAAVATAVVVSDIREERARQVAVERFGPQGDDQHLRGELVRAAICYAYSSLGVPWFDAFKGAEGLWPWTRNWWKPKGRRRDLIRAAALLVAEIERLDRLTAEAARAVKQ